MAYDDRRYGRHEAEPTDQLDPGPRGYPAPPGYRDEPSAGAGYGAGAGDYDDAEPTLPATAVETDPMTGPAAAQAPPVFETRGAADPSRDRFGVHLVWELVLLLGIAGVAYLLFQLEPDAVRGSALADLLVAATGYGFLGLAAGVTLRAGAPNLAIGPVAAAAGAYLADRGGDGMLIPTVFMLGVAILFGLAVAAVVGVFHVPGWAASLAAAGVVVVWLQLQPAEVPLAGEFDPTGRAAFLFAAMAAAGVLGGLLATVRPVRHGLGRFRPVGDPAQRRGGHAALVTGGALVLSMVLSVVAGVVLVTGDGGPAQGSVGVDWLTWTMLGMGVALVGGTSAYGRRGGVFGTVFAVVALVLFDRYQRAQDWEISLLATAVAAVVLGLVVTRLVERFGRPAGADGATWTAAPAEPAPARAEQWTETAPAGRAERAGWPVMPASEGRPAAGADSWSSGLPARPAPVQPAPWEDDRWTR